MRRLVSFPLLRMQLLKFEQAALPDDLQHFLSRQPDQYNDTGKNRPARLLVNVLWMCLAAAA
jgi:hypothetical protein